MALTGEARGSRRRCVVRSVYELRLTPKQILDEVDSLKGKGEKVVKFSITGYSLGGLISRYAIGYVSSIGIVRRVTDLNQDPEAKGFL